MNMTEEMKQMIDVLKKYEKGVFKHGGKKYFAPNIPDKIMKQIFKNFDGSVPINSVVAFFDMSMFGKGGSGLLFTVDGLYAKSLGKPDYIKYKDVLYIDFDKNNYPRLEVGKLNNYVTIYAECVDKIFFRSMIFELRSIDKDFGQTTMRESGTVKKKAMPENMRKQCHAIIHAAAAGTGAVGAGAAQAIAADNAVIVPIQITMITTLGKQVFDLDITEAMAKSILASAGATIAGRTASQFLVGWIPGIGNMINMATAAGVTEVIGWIAANDFYNRYLQGNAKLEGMKSSYEQASAEYEAKLRKQAEEFLKQKENVDTLVIEYEILLDEYEKHIQKLENENASFIKIIELKNELENLKSIKKVN